MSKYKTRPIGEIFEYCRLKFQVVEHYTCKGCHFWRNGICINFSKKTGYCSRYIREDDKSVIFKQVTE